LFVLKKRLDLHYRHLSYYVSFSITVEERSRQGKFALHLTYEYSWVIYLLFDCYLLYTCTLVQLILRANPTQDKVGKSLPFLSPQIISKHSPI